MSGETSIRQDQWPFPPKVRLTGRSVRLEPLSSVHLDDLWVAAKDARESFAYLKYGPFDTKAQLAHVVADLGGRADQPFWAVVGQGGPAMGWLSICDVSQTDGAFEIGSIWFSPDLQGTREARDALFLLMCLGMEDLAYARLVWRCQVRNRASYRAAENLGFTYEGTWRQAAFVKGAHHDVAWFSILRSEWPACRDALDRWLAPENFDETGQQLRPLQDLR